MKPSLPYGDILWLDSTDSTNSELRRHAEDLDNLSIIAARNQTEGRGQGSHSWSSAAGENLTFSILLRFDECRLEAVRQQIINSFITPAIQSFLEEEGVSSWVKQPNDIWVKDRKICGILVENILMGQWVKWSIVGVGLNLNQETFPEELPNPVSLTQLTGKKYPLEQTLERIHLKCKKNWENVFVKP